MEKVFYPDDWRIIAHSIKEANHYICQECGVRCRRPGEMYLGPQYELTISHYHGDYDGAAIFVAALCLPCHFRHDCRYVWRARHRHERKRRHEAGQLELHLPSTVGIHL